jgi:hypothetical protein
MEEREITEDQVKLVLRRPMGDPEPGNRPDTLVYRGLLGGKTLKVVVDSVDTERVVTLAWKDEDR